jgi:hypothetical protein
MYSTKTFSDSASSQWGKTDKVGPRVGPYYKKGAERTTANQVAEPFKEAREAVPGRFKGKQISSGPHVNPTNMRMKTGKGSLTPDQVQATLAEVKKKGGIKPEFKTSEIRENGPTSVAGIDDGCFGRSTYWAEPYTTGPKYLETQPMDKRKKGFGCGDADKRGEFGSYIRTMQFREQLKREEKMADAVAAVQMEKLGLTKADVTARMAGSATSAFGNSSLSPGKTRTFAKETQFDRLRDQRDDVYMRKSIHSPDRCIDKGMMSTSSAVIGEHVASVEPERPSHPRRSVTKEFYRTNNYN